jgi:hypothetical protein
MCWICQNEYAIQVKNEIGYDWAAGEEAVRASSRILCLFSFSLISI